MVGEAKHGWVDATLKSHESPAAVAQLVLLPYTICEKFSHGLVAIKWGNYSAGQQKSTSFLAPEPELFQKNRVQNCDQGG